jgi:hypothetical protein
LFAGADPVSLFNRIKSLNCSFGGFGTEALKEQWMDLLEFSHNGVAINDSDTAGSLNMEDFTLVKVVSRRPTPELTLQERQLFQLSQDISATLHQEVRTARASSNLVFTVLRCVSGIRGRDICVE